jgi:hypothetical protein
MGKGYGQWAMPYAHGRELSRSMAAGGLWGIAGDIVHSRAPNRFRYLSTRTLSVSCICAWKFPETCPKSTLFRLST